MKVKIINLEAERGTKKEACIKKIVNTVNMLQHIEDEKKTAIGTTLCGYMECCKDIGYISNDEYKMLKEMVIGITNAKCCVIIAEGKS